MGALKDSVFLKPTEDNWRRIVNEFEEKWNFPNCLGAIDGKHNSIAGKFIYFDHFLFEKFFICLLILLYICIYIDTSE